MRHLHRSFLDVRGQGDPDFTIIREGAALIRISSGTAAAIYHLTGALPTFGAECRFIGA
jgi:hypothetical protein